MASQTLQNHKAWRLPCHITNAIVSIDGHNPNHATTWDSEARRSGAKGKLKRCGSVAVVGVTRTQRCACQSSYAIGGNIDLFKEALGAIFGAVELAQKTCLVHIGSANGYKLLAVAGQHRLQCSGQ